MLVKGGPGVFFDYDNGLLIVDPVCPTTVATMPTMPSADCFVTTSGGTGGGAICVFPFLYYNNLEITACTLFNHDQPWCATTYNYVNERLWGNCEGMLNFHRKMLSGLFSLCTFWSWKQALSLWKLLLNDICANCLRTFSNDVKQHSENWPGLVSHSNVTIVLLNGTAARLRCADILMMLGQMHWQIIDFYKKNSGTKHLPVTKTDASA